MIDDRQNSASKEMASRVDAQELLKGLSSLLGEQGQVKGTEEAERIASLMKDAKKLVSRCVYVNILKATVEEEVLLKFIDVGGWDLMYTWLKEAKTSENSSFLLELLKVYQQMPVSVDLLKKNSCAKTIKQISKSDDLNLKSLGSSIVDLWMQKIKEKSSNTSSSSSSDKSKKKRKHRDSGEKDERSPSSKSHKSEHHSKKDKSVSNKDSSASKTEDKKSPEKTEVFDITKLIKKDRPKTVKTAPSKFRSTGLEQETNLQPKKKGSNEKDKSQNIIKRPSAPLKVGQPPEKKTKSLAPNPVNPLLKSANEASVIDKIKGNASANEGRGRIKIIPAKPRPVQDLQESNEFMKSLNAAHTPGVVRRKRKTSAQPNQKPTSPTSPTPKVPSFYRDTMDTSDNKEDSAMSPVENGEQGDSQEKNGAAEDGETKTEDAEGKDGEEKKDEDKESVASSESSTAKDPKKKKKKVTWVEEHKIKTIHYFELDETERVNVNKLKDFQEMQKQEMMQDRQAMQHVKRLSADNMQELIPWRRPALISNLTASVDHGCNSQERETQRQREAGVLAAIFFTKDMVPDSALDPEPEPMEPSEPKVIPLDDTTGTATEYVQTGPAPPPVTTDPLDPGQLSISPELARLVNSMQKAGHPMPPNHANGGPGSVNSNVQNLLSNIMTDKTNHFGKSDEMTENLKRMLDPFTGQLMPEGANPNMMHGQHPPNPQGPPGNSLLGSGPPGYPGPLMGPPGGRGMPPRGPPPPNFIGNFPPGPRPDGMEDWGENMQGGPMLRGRGRAGIPMRGGRGMGPPPMRGIGGRGRGGPPRMGRPVCRHFETSTGCKRGMNCAFLHPGINGPPL